MNSATADLKRDLEALHQAGVLSAIDSELAWVVSRLGGSVSGMRCAALAAAFASRAVQAGHVCLELPRLLSEPLVDESGELVPFQFPPLPSWLDALSAHPAVSDGTRRTPMILEGSRVYLQRYFDYQTRLVAALRRRAHSCAFDVELLRDGMNRLFGAALADAARGSEPRQGALQAVAAVTAVTHQLAVISGGPGTGKTTTVARVLALLGEQALRRGAGFHVTLVAPTGKAAQRLSEAIAQNVAALDTVDSLRTAIQRPASTIHRTLGFQPRTPNQFAHGALAPLNTDVVLVDEASMVDLALMTKLVEAVPETARLIFLGDKDQLASVEAGAIFGDVFNAEADHRMSAELAECVKKVTGVKLPISKAPTALADCTVHLEHSYRYDPNSAIAALSRAVRSGDATAALAELERPGRDVTWLRRPEAERLDPQADAELVANVRAGYAPFLKAEGPEERLAALGHFRLLTPHRRGPLGTDGLNRLAEQALHGGRYENRSHYPGRPILITSNDYQLDLFNGDVGVIERDPQTGALLAYFVGRQGLRSVHPARLPSHETVYAMTVHKSQGSEFDQITLVLPELPSPLVTRELLYTGLTRARKAAAVRGAPSVIRAAIAARIQRASGLRERLWGVSLEAQRRT